MDQRFINIWGKWSKRLRFDSIVNDGGCRAERKPGGGVGEGLLQKKLSRGVRSVYQNSSPIYDQKVRYSPSYLLPDQKFETLFMTCLISFVRDNSSLVQNSVKLL